VLVALVIVHFIRIQPKMRELANNADGSLRKDLMEMMAQERAECDRRLEAMTTKIGLMQQTIDGLHNQLLAQSSALALRLTPAPNAASEAATRIVERLSRDLGPEDPQQ
jgi:hypothetical protein